MLLRYPCTHRTFQAPCIMFLRHLFYVFCLKDFMSVLNFCFKNERWKKNNVFYAGFSKLKNVKVSLKHIFVHFKNLVFCETFLILVSELFLYEKFWDRLLIYFTTFDFSKVSEAIACNKVLTLLQNIIYNEKKEKEILISMCYSSFSRKK